MARETGLNAHSIRIGSMRIQCGRNQLVPSENISTTKKADYGIHFNSTVLHYNVELIMLIVYIFM